MAGRRLLYLAALAGCLVFYFLYEAWFSHFALLLVLCLPWLSLAVSLPAMLTVHFTLQCPAEILMGTPVIPVLQIHCKLPAPLVHYKLRVRHAVTGKSHGLQPGAQLHTEHCGILTLDARSLWVCDYMGLFRRRCRVPPQRLAVLPVPVPQEHPPSLQRYLAGSWKPKFGGGFSENHDLRLYRPGDSLRQIHWKLAAKTGKLIFREPIEPLRDMPMITLVLAGTADQLDEKLGKLSWTMGYFLDNQLPHKLRCLTGNGIETSVIAGQSDAEAALHHLLEVPCADTADIPAEWAVDNSSLPIGGGAD